MAQYPIVTTSDNGKVIQYILDSTNNRDMNVQHHINLDSNQDAVLGEIIVYERSKLGDAAFEQICSDHQVDDPSNNTEILILFKYNYIDPDPPRPYKIVKTFPVEGYYFVPGKPKVLAAAVGPGALSRTGGEAL